MAYAQVFIEDRPEPGGDVVRYRPGDEVPDTISGYDELVEHGSVVEEFDEDADVLTAAPPDEVVIDGVVYKRAAETMEVDNHAA